MNNKKSITKKKNTSVLVEDNYQVVRLHYTDIVKFSHDIIILNHGGYVTPTTKRRMNQASQQYNLKLNVFSKDGVMYVNHNGIILPFDGESITLINP